MSVREPAALKVMSFNVRYGTADDGENSWPFRREACLELIRSSGCHLIGLQEALAFQLHEIREAMPFYHWVGVGREDGLADGEHCAILYDTRSVELIGSNTFWFSDTPEVAGSTSWGNTNVRICTHGSFVFADSRLDLYNLHIDHEVADSRLKSIELLLSRLEAARGAIPVIVTGDFNCGESSPPVRLLGSVLTDTYRATYPDDPEEATYNGWAPVAEGDKIDYIFVDGNFTTVDAAILRAQPFGKWPSDHYAVVATVALT